MISAHIETASLLDMRRRSFAKRLDPGGVRIVRVARENVVDAYLVDVGRAIEIRLTNGKADDVDTARLGPRHVVPNLECILRTHGGDSVRNHTHFRSSSFRPNILIVWRAETRGKLRKTPVRA